MRLDAKPRVVTKVWYVEVWLLFGWMSFFQGNGPGLQKSSTMLVCVDVKLACESRWAKKFGQVKINWKIVFPCLSRLLYETPSYGLHILFYDFFFTFPFSCHFSPKSQVQAKDQETLITCVGDLIVQACWPIIVCWKAQPSRTSSRTPRGTPSGTGLQHDDCAECLSNGCLYSPQFQ